MTKYYINYERVSFIREFIYRIAKIQEIKDNYPINVAPYIDSDHISYAPLTSYGYVLSTNTITNLNKVLFGLSYAKEILSV